MIQSLWAEVATTRQYHSKYCSYYLITVGLRCENHGATEQPVTVTFVDTVGTTMSFAVVGLPFAEYQGILQEIRCCNWLTNGSRGVNTLTMLARSGPIDLLCLGGIATFSQKMAQLNELNMRIHDS